MEKQTPAKLTQTELEAARDWLKDCVWANMESEDFDDVSDCAIERGVAKHYSGGVEEFKRNCQ
jgi:hypothetical protein